MSAQLRTMPTMLVGTRSMDLCEALLAVVTRPQRGVLTRVGRDALSGESCSRCSPRNPAQHRGEGVRPRVRPEGQIPQVVPADG